MVWEMLCLALMLTVGPVLIILMIKCMCSTDSFFDRY
jgi:hypothetical protein